MKTINRKLLIFFGCFMLFIISCKKEIQHAATDTENSISGKPGQGHLQQTKTFSADVVRSWLNMQLTMFKVPLPAGTGTAGTDRAQAYSGLALYEAVVPGMPAYQSLTGQLSAGYPAMPATEPGKAYHWGASANAALAEVSRRLFPTTAAANITSMNNLEAQWQTAFSSQADAPTIQRSVAFGREVAIRIATWAATDGAANVNPPYIPPVGLGMWVPTNPAAPIANPYASQRRLVVPESDDNTALQPLPAFSTSTTSAYYAMVKELHDASLVLTNDQKAMADYFKDNPGYGPGGGFVWILMEALRLSNVKLDQAALAYAKVGMAQNDATIVLFTNKYIFNVMRPVTYIKTYIDPAWNTYIPTPNHPEFPSGHATTNGAVLAMMSHSFGENFPMTLHIYDYLNYPARHYNNFTQMGLDMADSRFYGGLHYMETCEKSLVQGKQVAQNILDNVQFLKE